ncbi:RNA polymerase sigma factor [Brevundimonas bacteroides]|uniref:RNA polymerase sigma factor n=1 Tax=Brevundimonas bacteroides TaxID=74311 RepID=UPI000558DAB3|nr:sigma-70 family RNA polymerase sigma factor [Brevundimonas bacteroides]
MAELAMQFRPALQRYFLRRRLTREDAEDAVQEVFARLSRRAGLASIDNIEGYLFETAGSVTIDHQRRGRVRAHDRHDAYDDERHGFADFASDRLLQGRQELQIVLAALRELPERSRNVFILARLEQMRHAEIARRLGISVSTVEKHVVRALAHLTLRLGEARR